jgi:1-acyl-sn-glycerol-3-phosphate acyltransferase
MTDVTVTHGGQHASAQREARPHKWALSLWARAFRRAARPWTVKSHVNKFCRPFTIEGGEKLAAIQNPMLIIANHTSHFDTVIVLSLLPNHIYDRTAVVAAADRMYRERVKGALAYSQWLLHNKWSLLIFPEGKRSRTGEILPFHGGPAILATMQNVPVLPIHIEGANRILPPGTNRSQPAPVVARVGDLLTFPEGTSIGEAKHAMEQAVHDLAGTPAITQDQAAAS